MAYDGFVAKHGYLHAKANKLAFKGDPDLPLLLSLENFDPESCTAEKADIFYRRTVGVVRKVDRCVSAEEALLISLHERGRIPTMRAAHPTRQSCLGGCTFPDKGGHWHSGEMKALQAIGHQEL